MRIYSFNINSIDFCNVFIVLVSGNAAGDLAPPMVVFNYERIPNSVVNLMPPKWGIGKSQNGWMTGETFFEYICNIFYPWLVECNVEFPIILYVDGHTSHLTYHLSEFCSEKGIILIALYPNATHILQPMDIGVFHPLKAAWRNGVHEWKLEHGHKLKKEHFAGLLNDVIKKGITKTTLENAFKASGLCPLNPDAINFEKLLVHPEISQQTLNKNETTVSTNSKKISSDTLSLINEIIGKEQIEIFKANNSNNWNGNVEDTSLYKFWKSIQESRDSNSNQNDVLVLEGDWINEILEVNPLNIAEVMPTYVSEADELNLCEVDLSNVPHASQLNVEASSVNITEAFQFNVTKADASNVSEANQLNDSVAGGPNIFKTNSSSVPELCSLNTSEAGPSGVSETEPSNKSKCEPVAVNIPSPFKSVLFWPKERVYSQSNRKPKFKLPSVASSDTWKEYYRKKEAEKNMKEEERTKRKRIREENKLKKEAAALAKKDGKRKGKLDEIEVLNDSSSEVDDDDSNENFEVGNYVIVK